jgi:hypothetical protein
MNLPISVRVKYTLDGPLRVAKFVQNERFVYRHDVILTAGIVFFGFALLIAWMANDLPQLNILGVLLFSAIPAFVVGLCVYLMHGPLGSWLAKRRAKKHFKSSPIMNDDLLFEFSNEGIRSSGNLSSSFLKWEAFTKVVESETDLMFYTANERYLSYVPKRAFGSNDDLHSVKKFLHETL